MIKSGSLHLGYFFLHGFSQEILHGFPAIWLSHFWCIVIRHQRFLRNSSVSFIRLAPRTFRLASKAPLNHTRHSSSFARAGQQRTCVCTSHVVRPLVRLAAPFAMLWFRVLPSDHDCSRCRYMQTPLRGRWLRLPQPPLLQQLVPVRPPSSAVKLGCKSPIRTTRSSNNASAIWTATCASSTRTS